ncbi:hypothetical protein J6590_093550, partial [Homalodisca vitripennis]
MGLLLCNLPHLSPYSLGETDVANCANAFALGCLGDRSRDLKILRNVQYPRSTQTLI